MNIKKIKRNKLIRKLFYSIINPYGIDVPIKLIIRENAYRKLSSNCRTIKDQDSNIAKFKITLNMVGLQSRIMFGYSNTYYNGRHEKLNPFVLNNRHNALRFILYHESYHAIAKYFKYDNTEFYADDFAITHLNQKINSNQEV